MSWNFMIGLPAKHGDIMILSYPICAVDFFFL